MNIIAIAIAGGSLAALPVASVTDIGPINPFDGLTVSAAGIGVTIDADGLEPTAAAHSDFEIEIRFKSGSPVRVRL